MKIAVLLSGGVDSSVALKLLKDQGHQPTSFYLKMWQSQQGGFIGDCPSKQDIEYAQAVCDQIGVPLKIVPIQKEYFETVVKYTLSELKAGRTPSPDLFCNKWIKFGTFFDIIGSEYEKVATGHYARLLTEDKKVLLKTSPDPVKDQTYFLSHLNRTQLARALFPIGAMTKTQVRNLAQQFDLATKNRKDSQGVCFLGNIRFKDIIRAFLGENSGDIVELKSLKKLGEHEGHWYYTIGQRSGLGLSDGPWYVVKKDTQNNIVFVSHQNNMPEFEKNRFRVGLFNWIPSPPRDKRLWVKIRHGTKKYECELRLNDQIASSMNLEGEVVLSEKDQGIAPGQLAVFYQADICLGCGTILN